jgi:hypothetical protein
MLHLVYLPFLVNSPLTYLTLLPVPWSTALVAPKDSAYRLRP